MKNRHLIALGAMATIFSLSAVSTEPQKDQVTKTKPQSVTASAQESTAQQIQRLSYTAQNQSENVQRRVDALHQLSQFPNQNALVAVSRALKDSNSDIRQAAIVGAKPYQFEYRWKLVAPLLNDESSDVQLAALVSLIPDYTNMNEQQQKELDKIYPSAIKQLKQHSGSEKQLLLADVYRWHQDFSSAELIYQQLITNPAMATQVSLSLSDNYRAQQQDENALEVLNHAIANDSTSAQLYYSKALTLVRIGNKSEAAIAIEQATKYAPDNSYYWYLNGVLQEPLDIAKATDSFEKAYLISGAPEQLYAVCDIYVRTGHEKAEVCLTELEKVAPPYVIEELKSKQKKIK
ncbi:HEAT repeat domain-containing protein [Vibrio mediterranei]|uniref:HEAT repeat domain-containing protein n=1 Tax=Vibrio mediterranei TaxID=689 RepID=UPI00148E6EB4|nr:HEAT repeat domain-containing protein [Vibrio mediterranei]NOI22901.1 HEAT repeat domain-containing protein [Vibrio mediterranei]